MLNPLSFLGVWPLLPHAWTRAAQATTCCPGHLRHPQKVRLKHIIEIMHHLTHSLLLAAGYPLPCFSYVIIIPTVILGWVEVRNSQWEWP